MKNHSSENEDKAQTRSIYATYHKQNISTLVLKNFQKSISKTNISLK